jgi:hypothetical protein
LFGIDLCAAALKGMWLSCREEGAARSFSFTIPLKQGDKPDAQEG